MVLVGLVVAIAVVAWWRQFGGGSVGLSRHRRSSLQAPVPALVAAVAVAVVEAATVWWRRWVGALGGGGDGGGYKVAPSLCATGGGGDGMYRWW